MSKKSPLYPHVPKSRENRSIDEKAFIVQDTAQAKRMAEDRADAMTRVIFSWSEDVGLTIRPEISSYRQPELFIPWGMGTKSHPEFLNELKAIFQRKGISVTTHGY